MFITSDTHFGHEAMIRLCGRPFKDANHMDEILIANWNAIVRPKDTVWHLGDFAFRGKKMPAEYAKRLNGKIHICLGNHDKAGQLVPFAEQIVDTHYLRYNRMRFWLSHYPHRTWPNCHRGAFHLFGHEHGSLPKLLRSMDVGVDAMNEYRPYHLDEIVKRLEDQPSMPHHNRVGKSI